MMRPFQYLGVTVSLLATFASVDAFQVVRPSNACKAATRLYQSSDPAAIGQEPGGSGEDLNIFLQNTYPEYFSLLSKNKDVFKEVNGYKTGSTFFAPNSQAFANLGEKKLSQMKDDRNTESVEKMAAYHVIAEEAVREDALLVEDWTKPAPPGGGFRPLKLGGIVTLAGEVPIGRSKVGGFFGFGASEEEKIVIGPNARIVYTHFVGNSIVHEMDDFISPEILWRYFDQLRIPGI